MTFDANTPLADQERNPSTLPLPLLLGNAGAAVIQLDPQGRVQLWNQAAEKLFGWHADEVLGKLSPTVPNEIWEDNQSWFLRCLGGQTMSGVQLQRRRKDGSTINVHAWAWPVRNQQGLILGVMKMFFPVGERASVKDATIDQSLRQQTEQAHRFHKALVSLGKTDYPSLQSALHTLVTVASQTLNVERVSIWLFNESHDAINCSCLYQRSLDRFDSGMVLTAQDYPQYFQTLEQSRTIAASDARKDPRTSEYLDHYLEPLGITSMLDVPIRLHGNEIGIVCHEHVGSVRDWSLEEQSFAAAIADFVSLSFENHEHARAEQLLAAVVNGSPIGIQIFDQSGTLQRQNPAMLQLASKLNAPIEVGQSNILQTDQALTPDDLQMARQALSGEMVELPQRVFESKEPHDSPLVIDSLYYPVKGQNDETAGLACFHRDVSERRRLEEQLQQTQRLESLGLLAGTIAHDFNGLLTAIYGFLELAQEELPSTHMARTYLQSGLQAAMRATELTEKLLSYAGKGKRDNRPFDLSALVLEVSELLRNILKKHGTLHLDLSPSLPDISGDMTQIRQLVMNLISNAAESHSNDRGMVSIKTDVVTVHENDLARCQVAAPDTGPGPYVMLQVSDQGTGISPEVLNRIFDPFFTTKSKGRGLGLAAIVGIVRSHKAALMVDTHVGKGTTFTVYLPVVSAS